MNETEIVRSRTWTTLTCSDGVHRIRSNERDRLRIEDGIVDTERAVMLWGDAVFRLALCRTHNKADAEDVVQTVFMKLHQRQSSFDSDEHLKAWLLCVTATCSIDLLRDSWAKNHAALENADEVIDRFSSSREEEAFCDSPAVLQESQVADAVALLPEKQRVAVHLYYFEDYATKDIASLMNEKSSTVRSYLHRARKTLKKQMGEIHA